MSCNREALRAAILAATRLTLADLFSAHQDERFYYIALITTGEGHTPFLTAWSREALARESTKQGCAPEEIKWSYADSPYDILGEEHFAEVGRLLAARNEKFGIDDNKDWSSELDLRLEAMTEALAQLDAEGIFGTVEKRLQLVLNVEVMPPDSANAERALRLNPKEALVEWLAEAGEL